MKIYKIGPILLTPLLTMCISKSDVVNKDSRKISSSYEGELSASSGTQCLPFAYIDGFVDEKAAPGVNEKDLKELKLRFEAGDRGGVYLTLYRLTGQEFWLIDGAIATFSGLYGGVALQANYLVKTANKDLYKTTLDSFSLKILGQLLTLVEESVAKGKKGYVEPHEFLVSGDGPIWKSYGLSDHFPGHILFLDISTFGYKHISEFFASGTWNSINATLFSGDVSYGKKPSEYKNNDLFEIERTSDQRFTVVRNKKLCRIEVIYDHKARGMGIYPQISDEPLIPGSLQWYKRLAMWEFLQANQDDYLPFNEALWDGDRAVESPNIIGDYYFDTIKQQWHVINLGNLVIKRKSVIDLLNRNRTKIIEKRRSRGLPDEPQLPGRYIK